jgi:hypothetical protein
VSRLDGPDPARGRGQEGGYVLILTTLLVVPLIAFVALAVDVGVWYTQASANQRTADAAALAGVVWLPDEATAIAVASETAEKNGYQDGFNSTVIIERLGQYELRVKVASASAQFFSHLFLDEFAITRAAVAEYVPPVPLGSPRNTLGTGNLAGFVQPDGFWLAASGRCSVAENGDLRLAQFAASYPGGSPPPLCSGDPNLEHDPAGYTFAVNVVSTANPTILQVYDGSYRPGVPGAIDASLRNSPLSQLHTVYEVRGPGPSWDWANLPVLATVTAPSRDASWFGLWRHLHTISAGSPTGTYYIRVRTTFGGGDTVSWGSNSFALRARVPGPLWGNDCTTIDGQPGYHALCPQVYALHDLPLFANLSGGLTDFFLTEIEPRHAGKTLQISLFDVGEGAERIQIIDPNGNPTEFTWETDCVTVVPAADCGSAVPVTSIDVAGTGPQPGGDRGSPSKFNDRTIVISVPLRADYGSYYAGNWWRVRYHFGPDMSDRTTWSIKILGDPVRLRG